MGEAHHETKKIDQENSVNRNTIEPRPRTVKQAPHCPLVGQARRLWCDPILVAIIASVAVGAVAPFLSVVLFAMSVLVDVVSSVARLSIVDEAFLDQLSPCWAAAMSSRPCTSSRIRHAWEFEGSSMLCSSMVAATMF